MVVENRSIRHSNLDCFLHCTTPVVTSQFLPKSEKKNLNKLWNPWERENVEYFKLSDVWNSYDEWSVYGAGVPIRLNDGETLVQYYVPYLSSIQIFTSSPSPPVYIREDAESGDGGTRDSSESYSAESESDKFSRWDGGSSEDGGDEHEHEHEIPWQVNDRLGYLYCQYIEKSAPYTRVPLTNKIRELARRYPGLMTLKSVDLSPASWMSVSWYPIYHIPMGRNIKDLSTCFLTYHTLSSSFQDMDVEYETVDTECIKNRKEGESIPLPSFGLATYKLQGSLWVSGRGGQDQDRLRSMWSVADSWLKQLKVQHHDFNYFSGIRLAS